MTEKHNKMSPSPNDDNGRDSAGKFAKGNRGGPGNPHAQRVALLRSTMLRAVTPVDIQAVAKTLLAKAKGGDVTAIKLLLDRLLGPAESLDFLERLERLEQRLNQRKENRWP